MQGCIVMGMRTFTQKRYETRHLGYPSPDTNFSDTPAPQPPSTTRKPGPCASRGDVPPLMRCTNSCQDLSPNGGRGRSETERQAVEGGAFVCNARYNPSEGRFTLLVSCRYLHTISIRDQLQLPQFVYHLPGSCKVDFNYSDEGGNTLLGRSYTSQQRGYSCRS